MKVLYVVAACLSNNTSANMSHNGYVQGLLENDCDVDILMAKDSWGQHDNMLPMWEEAHYHIYRAEAWHDKIRKRFNRSNRISVNAGGGVNTDECHEVTSGVKFKKSIREIVKDIYYRIFPSDPIYPLEKTWLKSAMRFKGETEYDLVVSNSSPAASHKIVAQLTSKGRLKYKRWIQIWEDPWYFDLYGGHSEAIRVEEHALLKCADEIYYVSPLTLVYQQRHYADCAHKMKHIPLPYFKFSKNSGVKSSQWSFGYFGDYYSKTRNLSPFYSALLKVGADGYIYGDSDIFLQSTDKIVVSGRVTLDKLNLVQQKTSVLVHLSNLSGGQIPGKIYHYSASDKPILFILDGTDDEQRILKEYFGQFGRFCFCNNNEESIARAMEEIIQKDELCVPLECFAPQSVVRDIL